MIQASNISLRVTESFGLSDISLTAQPGNVLVLLGANGAGKSTLLKILTSDLHPDKGEIWVDGKALSQFSNMALAQFRAVVCQDSVVSFPFSVFDVVMLGRLPHEKKRSSSKYDMDIVWAAMEKAGITRFANQMYGTLSGGERQRVNIARALAQIWEPVDISPNRYLLLDEPTSNLDLAQQHAMLQMARTMASEGVGVVVVLHDLNLAAQYADEIVVLKQGRLLGAGSPDKIMSPQTIGQAFNIDVLVEKHPCHDCPLIVPVGAIEQHALPAAHI